MRGKIFAGAVVLSVLVATLSILGRCKNETTADRHQLDGNQGCSESSRVVGGGQAYFFGV